MPSPIPVLLISAFVWLVWHITRDLFVRSPLDNIPGPASESIVTGNLKRLFDRHDWEFIDLLDHFKNNKVVRLTGLFGHRILYVFDSKALQQVVLREVDIYSVPEWQLDISRMTIGPGLAGVHGDRHRRQRKMLNPAFSIKHMRSLTPVFYGLAHKLCTGIEAQIGDKPTTVDMLNWFGRISLELMGQGGLGYSFDPLDKPVSNPLGDALKQFFPAIFAISHWQFLFKHLKKLGPPKFRSAVADLIPIQSLRHLKKIVDQVETESNEILKQKRATLQKDAATEKGEGNDVMSILLRANMAAADEDRLSEEELIGQMSLLVLAGSDTTSNALSQLVLTFAERPEVQDKLRAEVLEAQAQYGEDIPYDELIELPYLDAVCRESLRLYPPNTHQSREATKDIVMPLSQPLEGVDGTTINEIPVPAGTTVLIAIRAINTDKDIWGDDALEFKPERWLAPLPRSVTEARIPGVYSNLMTFLGGGRACLGFKYSQLEMKVVLSLLLSKFKVSMAESTKDVTWNLAIVRYPTVGKESTKPELPVRLERIK